MAAFDPGTKQRLCETISSSSRTKTLLTHRTGGHSHMQLLAVMEDGKSQSEGAACAFENDDNQSNRMFTRHDLGCFITSYLQSNIILNKLAGKMSCKNIMQKAYRAKAVPSNKEE